MLFRCLVQDRIGTVVVTHLAVGARGPHGSVCREMLQHIGPPARSLGPILSSVCVPCVVERRVRNGRQMLNARLQNRFRLLVLAKLAETCRATQVASQITGVPCAHSLPSVDSVLP